MDDVYKLYNANASPKVHIKEYFDEYLSMISSAECFIPVKRDDKAFMSLMDVQLGEEEMSMLASYCRYSCYFCFHSYLLSYPILIL